VTQRCVPDETHGTQSAEIAEQACETQTESRSVAQLDDKGQAKALTSRHGDLQQTQNHDDAVKGIEPCQTENKRA
jgi:hypothetical protein